MADTGVHGLSYAVSAISLLIYCRLRHLSGGWQVKRVKWFTPYSASISVDEMSVNPLVNVGICLLTAMRRSLAVSISLKS